MQLKINQQARGTRIITGEECRERRKLLNQLIEIAEDIDCQEITLPAIEPSELYVDKAGKEILNQMYVFQDRKDRSLCLRPEGTATVQQIADTHWNDGKERRLWYFERCYRYERPQAGRYREFFQFGVEIINPGPSISVTDWRELLIKMALMMIWRKTYGVTEVNRSVKRGLDYYTGDGFEISCPQLGAQKQVCGGGAYKQGIGFAIGFDRLMLCK